MTKTKRTLKGLLTVLLSLAMVVAMSVSMLASAAATVTETVVVTQVIENGTVPKEDTYTYWLTPLDASCPLPNELKSIAPTEKGKYKVGTISGNSTDQTALTLTFELDKTKAGVYTYFLETTPDIPSEDKFSPDNGFWKFGFRIKNDEQTGKLIAQEPEVCVLGETEYFDIGEDGFPTKVELINSITGTKTTPEEPDDKDNKGDKGDKGDPGKNGSNGTNGKNGTDGRNGTNGTSTVKTITQTVGKAINTGDPNHILLWGGLTVISAGALIAILIVRRKKEKDEETN